MEKAKLELYFNDPRLAMTVLGRFFVRFSFYVGYCLVGAITASLLLNPVSSRSFWLGMLLTFFVIDRILHVGEAEDSLSMIPSSGRFNMGRVLAPKSFALIESSLDRASLSGGDFRFILLSKLLDSQDIKSIFARLEVKEKDFFIQAEREFSENQMNKKEDILPFINVLMLKSFEESYVNSGRFIEPRDLLSGLSGIADRRLDKVFSLFSVRKEDMDTAIIFGRASVGFFDRLLHPLEAAGNYHYRLRHRVMNRAWTARPTRFLDKFSEDFTDLARVGSVGFLVGHEKEYHRLIDVLARPQKPSALLVGDPGVGKEAILKHLAYNIVKDNVPPVLFDKRLVSLNISALISGSSAGESQGRVASVLSEIISAGNVIVYIPDFDNLTKTSGEQYLNAADILVPAIRKGLFPVIGASYPREYKKFIEPQTDLASLFEVIRVEEISEADAMKILTFSSIGYERIYGVTITMDAIKKAVVLAHKYFRNKPLPVSAADLLKEALSEAQRTKEKLLNANLIISIAERKVNIPIHQFDSDEAKMLLGMEAIVHKKLVDQEEAVRAVAMSLREYRSGLTRRGGPIASFLFVGPTGVGKTELSKILAEIQFGSPSMMTRFDMSEYQDKQSLYRFIGSPDGVVNGALTDAILQKPYSLVLLDEFEKAHPEILNLFLQVFDDGRLTDNLGRVADFGNAIIIATSNAHSEYIQKALEEGKTINEINAEVKHHLMDYFKPELINRFSGIIVFKPLSMEDTKKVAALQLAILARDLMDAQNIVITFNELAINKIGELGFSTTFGARPLRGVISEKLRGPIAEKILRREITRNDSIVVSLEGEEFVFTAGHQN